MLTKNEIKPELIKHVKENIIPVYNNFDKGHQQSHLDRVWLCSLDIIEKNNLDVNMDMMYIIVYYHDLGLAFNRYHHHFYSGQLLKADKYLRHHFTNQEIKTMVDAVEDHRASHTYEPRNIYGKIIGDGDRQMDMETIMQRFYWAIFTEGYTNTDLPDNCKTLNKDDLFDAIVYPRFINKFGGNGEPGYLKLNFKSTMQDELSRISNMTRDDVYKTYSIVYDTLSKNGDE